MADEKISGYDELAETPASGDLVEIVDVSDSTDAPTGTNKKVTRANLVGGLATSTDLTNHTSDSSAAHAASAISFGPAGSVAATDVQAAIVEVDGDVTAHVGDPSAAHAASAISFTPAGTIAATTVQAAIEEVASEAGGGGASDLDGLSDVVITAAASGDILRHNGTNWVDTPGTDHFEAAGAVATHEADTTSVHGITDTSLLVTTTGSQTLTNKTITAPIITLEQGAAPSNTAEGRIQWDTDDNRLVVGDGSGTKVFSDDSVVQARANHTGTQTAATISDFDEAVDDRVGVLVVGGTGITATYNDGAGTHTIATTITQYTDEMARDALGTALTAGSGITITPNDGADTITIAATGGGGSFDPSAADFVVAARVFGR